MKDYGREFVNYLKAIFSGSEVGFSISGGTTSKTLTVDETVAMSSKAPKASPVFTGDVTLAGNAINPTLPAFLATAALQSNVTGDGTEYTVQFTTEIYDQGANFDGTSTFTAPVTGKYDFQATLLLSGIDVTHTRMYAAFVTSNRNYSCGDINIGAVKTDDRYQVVMVAMGVDMDASDTCVALFAVDGTGGKVVDITATSSRFSGRLVC